MRIRVTIDITHSRPPAAPTGHVEMGTVASTIDFDGQDDAGELKTRPLQQPSRFGFDPTGAAQ